MVFILYMVRTNLKKQSNLRKILTWITLSSASLKPCIFSCIIILRFMYIHGFNVTLSLHDLLFTCSNTHVHHMSLYPICKINRISSSFLTRILDTFTIFLLASDNPSRLWKFWGCNYMVDLTSHLFILHLFSHVSIAETIISNNKKLLNKGNI